jgi:hypothetical protein
MQEPDHLQLDSRLTRLATIAGDAMWASPAFAASPKERTMDMLSIEKLIYGPSNPWQAWQTK